MSSNHGSGETDQRGGGERKKVAVVSPVRAVTGHELRENCRRITEIHRRQALRQLILSSFCFFVASMASAAEPGIRDSSTLRDKAVYFQQDLRDKHLLEGLYISIVPAAPAGTKLRHTVEEPGNVIHAGVWTGRYLAGVGYQYAVTQDPKVRGHGDEILHGLRKLQEGAAPILVATHGSTAAEQTAISLGSSSLAADGTAVGLLVGQAIVNPVPADMAGNSAVSNSRAADASHARLEQGRPGSRGDGVDDAFGSADLLPPKANI
jgi:hypothetical protein